MPGALCPDNRDILRPWGIDDLDSLPMNHENPKAQGGHRVHPHADLLPEFRSDVVRRSHRLLAPLMKSYFRSEVRNPERLPRSQTIIVTHHDGGVLPINGICLGVAWYETFGFDRPLYVLMHDILHNLWGPFSKLLADSGGVRADRETMDAVLANGHSVLLFPGAARESFRSYWQRRNIDLGGRKGFVVQAIRFGLPVMPVVWALPAKITTEVLEPIDLSRALEMDLCPEHADDPNIVQRGFDYVLRKMRERLDALYHERRYPILG